MSVMQLLKTIEQMREVYEFDDDKAFVAIHTDDNMIGYMVQVDVHTENGIMLSMKKVV